MKVTHEERRFHVPVRGMGDVVAYVAKPVARAIDAVAGTDLKNCLACTQRQEDWNKAIPFTKA